jgi:hypothetical protein
MSFQVSYNAIIHPIPVRASLLTRFSPWFSSQTSGTKSGQELTQLLDISSKSASSELQSPCKWAYQQLTYHPQPHIAKMWCCSTHLQNSCHRLIAIDHILIRGNKDTYQWEAEEPCGGKVGPWWDKSVVCPVGPEEGCWGKEARRIWREGARFQVQELVLCRFHQHPILVSRHGPRMFLRYLCLKRGIFNVFRVAPTAIAKKERRLAGTDEGSIRAGENRPRPVKIRI